MERNTISSFVKLTIYIAGFRILTYYKSLTKPSYETPNISAASHCLVQWLNVY